MKNLYTENYKIQMKEIKDKQMERYLCIYDQLTLNKDAKKTHWVKQFLRQIQLEKTDSHEQKNKIGSLSHNIYKNQLKMG